jgi:hypothetical protein
MNAAFAKFNRTLHWTTSALGLASLVFFSITGITLNHPDWFSADRSAEIQDVELGEAWLADFIERDELGRLNLLTRELDARWGLGLPRNIDRDAVEWVLDYQRPGGLGTVVLDLESAVLTYESVSDGLVALVNDLHKGRHAGLPWVVLIDVVSVVCLVFALSGLVLLWAHASKRASTWPLVGLGLGVPLILFFGFVPW